MFESLFGLGTLEIAILRDTLLFVSMLVAWVYWQTQDKEQETKTESLDAQLIQREVTISGLNTRIREKENSLIELKSEIADLEKRNQDSLARAENAESRVGDLVNLVEEKEREIAALRARTRAMQDDFAIIVGIGPRVSSILRSAGITTFEKLAGALQQH